MKTFVISISEDHFEATLDGSLIANSRSSNDLLAVLDQIVAATGCMDTLMFASDSSV